MPNDVQLPATRAKNQDLQTMRFDDALEMYAPSLAQALPSHINIERFKRTLMTAVSINPDLAHADRRSLFNACSQCAHDGLYPDGREAALVIFRSKVKFKNARGLDEERWVDKVQYLPMIFGLRKRMRNTGQVLSATAEVVYRNDHFRHRRGENPLIEHEPCALDQDRGDPVGAYAIIKLTNGETLREVMGLQEIERVRAFSKTSKLPSGPWTTSWGEMARKTVLRRCSKAAPADSNLERLFDRDDEMPDLPSERAQIVPPRPRREDHPDPEPDEDFADEKQAWIEGLADEGPAEETASDPKTTYPVVDLDGVVEEKPTAEEAADAFVEILKVAARCGKRHLDGAWQDNAALLVLLERDAAAAFRMAIEAYDNAAAALIRELNHPGGEPQPQTEGSSAQTEDSARGDQAQSSAAEAGGSPAPTMVPEPATIKGTSKPDYRGWALLSLRKAVNQQKTKPALDQLLATYDDHIQAFKRAHVPDIARFDSYIAEAYGKLPAGA